MIAIASDHGGYDLKERVKKYLEERGLEYKDFGCENKNSCDYPDFIRPAAKAVAEGSCDRGCCAPLVSVFLSVQIKCPVSDALCALIR